MKYHGHRRLMLTPEFQTGMEHMVQGTLNPACSGWAWSSRARQTYLIDIARAEFREGTLKYRLLSIRVTE